MSTTERNAARLRLWNAMTPADRDYDRYVGQIPEGASSAYETDVPDDWKFGQMHRGCTCHINPPCWRCVEGIDPNEDLSEEENSMFAVRKVEVTP